MEQRITAITLHVKDLAQSRRFYEALGWEAGLAVGDIVCFQMSGFALILFPNLEHEAGVTEPSRPGGMALAHNVRRREEVDRVIEQALAAGATLARPAQQAEWGGYSGYFADPDGHRWEVAWNPHWPLAEDGSLTLPRP